MKAHPNSTQVNYSQSQRLREEAVWLRSQSRELREELAALREELRLIRIENERRREAAQPDGERALRSG